MIVSYGVAVVIHLMIEAPTVYSREDNDGEVQQSEKATESESSKKLKVIEEEVVEKKDK